ncbi:MAG: hypothetical protein NUV34_05010 [Sulfuricaulis sp.]|nr:hypothetical protein [Sulfuricaulis sp.]
MSKRDAEIYREAARSLAAGEQCYSCHAVHAAAGVPIWNKSGNFCPKECEQTINYSLTMLDRNNDPLSIRLTREDYPPQEILHLRVMLLCFMAAIAENK